MELIKKQIHMNQWKGNAVTQITLDEDFIVPDTLEDMDQVILDNARILGENGRIQDEKMTIKGKMEFAVLYRKENGGLETLGGNIPFEEMVNVPGLEEGDDVTTSWILEDMKAEMINSRKLGVQAVITVEIRAEGEENAYAASDVKMSGTEGGMIPEKDVPEVRTGIISPVVLALHRKDTYRIRENTAVTGGRPDIARLLWKEIHIGNQTVKPLEGRLYLEGQLNVFVIYETEEENMPVQWMEEVLPFSGDIEISQAHEGQIPQVSVRLSHGEIEVKPDAEGQMRELDVDVVLEMDIRLYEEKEETLIRDMYSNSSKLIPETKKLQYERLIAKNVCKPRIVEKIHLGQSERILQICHTQGSIQLDEVEPQENSLLIEGVLDVTILYLTSDDKAPVRSVSRQIPFKCSAQASGITKNSVYQLDTALEQLAALMTGNDTVEIRAAAALDFMILEPVTETVITGVKEEPLDLKALQALPGIAGYIVQEGDLLWDIAKKFHTTMGNIITTNELPGEQIKAGQRLLLVKEVGV